MSDRERPPAGTPPGSTHRPSEPASSADRSSRARSPKSSATLAPGRTAQFRRLGGQRLVQLALGRALHDPAHLGPQVSPATGELAQRSHRGGLLIRRSARATSRDVSPRPRSWRRESGQLADACRSRVLVSSSLQGGAGPAREGDRPTQVRGRGADNRFAAQRVLQGRAGIVWVAVRPGGVSRTATQYQRRQARIAVSSRGCWPRTTSAQGPGPVSLLASVTQPSHR